MTQLKLFAKSFKTRASDPASCFMVKIMLTISASDTFKGFLLIKINFVTLSPMFQILLSNILSP